MREIKFRAFYGGIMYDDLEAKRILYNKANGSTITVNAEIMQSTGLKDKNGVEIYEGDILQTNHALKGQVEWSKMASQWWTRFKHDRNIYRELVPSSGGGKGGELYCDWCEVIGNLYEHPELLNT